MSALEHFVGCIERVFPLENVFILAKRLAANLTLLPEKTAKCSTALKLRICEDVDPRDLLLALLAAAVLDVQPFLGDRRLHQPESSCQTFLVTPGLISEALSCQKDGLLHADGLRCKLVNALQTHALVFFTSGSSGTPVGIEKSWNQLLREVEILCFTFDTGSKKRFLSLVPAQHLFGFLFGVLLPVFSACEFRLLERPGDTLGLPGMDTHSCGALILTPSLWNGVRKKLLQVKNPLMLFTSGAAWGLQRFEELRALQNPHLELVDILGSTETGGIGYKIFNKNGLSNFILLPGVKLKEENGRWFVSSAYASSNQLSEWIALSDRFAREPSGEVRHLGRTDAVFKLAGKRFSLRECEEILRSLMFDAEVRCYFSLDESSPKGGKLIAFVSLKNTDTTAAAMRRHFLDNRSNISGAPIPNEIYFLDEFETNSMGKITFESLRNAARRKEND